VDNLERKKWKGSKLCQLCQAEETKDHIFFQCPGAVFVWAVVWDSMRWGAVPKSVWDLKKNFILSGGCKVWVLCGFCSVLYARRCGLIGMVLFLIIN
jgi:hypothetical protein